MSQIPTAEEHLTKNIDYVLEGDLKQDVIDAMIEYAKLHVQAALQAASEQAKVQPYPYNSCFECGRSDMDVNKQSILNAYPSSLIQ